MKTLRITLFAAAIALAASFSSCGGSTGPAGADGATGPQGPSGVTGTNAAFVSSSGDWQVASASGYNYLLASYNVSILTQDAVNTGVVMVYFEAATGVWAPLPYTYPVSSSSTVTQTLTFNYAVGVLSLQLQNSDSSVPLAPATATDYNVVVIPTSVIKHNPGLNLHDYNAVKQVMLSRGSL